MICYTNEWGEQFNNYETVYENTLEKMSDEDLKEELYCLLPYDVLLDWAINQPYFSCEFDTLIKQAKENWVNNYLNCIEEE